MGYPEGREPRYYWDKEPLGDETLVGIEAVVPTSGGDPAWGRWVYESRGITPFHGASRAVFAVLRDLMERFLLGILNIITKSRLSSKSSNGAKNAKPIPHTT